VLVALVGKKAQEALVEVLEVVLAIKTTYL
jgi:hypothetical protein